MRCLAAALAVVAFATAAQAHFVFVYVTDDGTESRVVFRREPWVPAASR